MPIPDGTAGLLYLHKPKPSYVPPITYEICFRITGDTLERCKQMKAECDVPMFSEGDLLPMPKAHAGWPQLSTVKFQPSLKILPNVDVDIEDP